MESIGNSNDRQIFYTNIWTDNNWLDNLPKDNWLVFPIGQDKDINKFHELADRCIDNNVVYACAAGKYCELIHDIFDNIVVAKKIANEESVSCEDDFENSPMTVWDNNFSSCFWFAIQSAHVDKKTISKIVCVDFTKQGVKRHLIDLIEKINNNWLPSEDEFESPIFDN